VSTHIFRILQKTDIKPKNQERTKNMFKKFFSFSLSFSFMFNLGAASHNVFAGDELETPEIVSTSTEVTHPNVKVLVVYHRPSRIIKSEVFTPIHVGRSCHAAQIRTSKGKYQEKEDDSYWFEENMIGDDTGENRSAMNRNLNELTATYWAWKNPEKLGNPEYIGIYHYHRYFDLFGPNEGSPFRSHKFDETQYIDMKACDDKIYELLQGNKDMLVPIEYVAGRWTGRWIKYFESLINGLEDQTYAHALEELKSKNTHLLKNMFVMKWPLFQEYCEYIFSILDQARAKGIASERSGRKLSIMGELLTSLFLYTKSHDGMHPFISLGIFEIRDPFEGYEETCSEARTPLQRRPTTLSQMLTRQPAQPRTLSPALPAPATDSVKIQEDVPFRPTQPNSREWWSAAHSSSEWDSIRREYMPKLTIKERVQVWRFLREV
jgi:hypothetical protein